MTILFSDGFDYYQTTTGAGSQNITLANRYTVPGLLSYFTYVPGFNNEGNCINFATSSSSDNSALLPVSEMVSNFTFGAHIYVGSYSTFNLTNIFNAYTPAGRYLTFSFYGGSTQDIAINSSGSTIVYIPKTTFTFATGKWWYVEFNCQQTATPNISLISLYINNTLVYSTNMVVSVAGTANTFNRFHIGKFTDGGSTSYMMDNLYLSDGDILGATQIKTVYPNSDTAQKDGLASSGTSNFSMINDSSAPTMVSSVTLKQENSKDIYGLGDISVVNTNDKVLAVQTISYGQNMSVSPTGTLIPSIISGSTEGALVGRLLDTKLPLAAATPHYTKNPNGNVDWTPTSVNALTVANKSSFPTGYTNVVYSIQNNTVTNLSGSTPTENNTVQKIGNALGFGVGSYSYPKSSSFRAIPPYSVEFEFNGMIASTAQIIMGVGTQAAPELLFRITTAGELQALVSGTTVITTLTYLNQIVQGTWYKIGLMIYASGTQTRIRGYLNGTQVFDQSIQQNINSTAAYRVGTGTDASTIFYGLLRNVNMGQSLFWDSGVADPSPYNNLVASFVGGVLTTDIQMVKNTGNTDPTISGNEMVFTGTQLITYPDSPRMRATPPFSVEFEFKTTASNVVQILFGMGQSTSSPELQFEIGATNIMRALSYTTSGATVRQTIDFINPVATNTWYKIGLMFYTTTGTDVRWRGFLNGIVFQDSAITQPWDSTAGFYFGGSSTGATKFSGSLRNLRIGQSLFWDPNASTFDPRSTSVFTIGTGGSTSNATGATLVAGDTPPTVNGNELVFNGNQRIRYSDVPAWNLTSPTSVEFEVLFSQIPATNQWIFTLGEAFGASNGMLTFLCVATTGQLRAYTVSGSSGGTQTVGNYNTTSVINTWYKLGFMYYNDGSNNRIRGYLNDVQAFDVIGTASFDSLYGLAIGNDNVVQSTQVRNFYGSVRNVYFAHTNFWQI